MSKIHDFKDSMEWGDRAGDDPFWGDIYRRAFADFVSFSKNNGNNTGQRLGVDRWIHLSSGKTLSSDEKKRSQVFPDFALEFQSNRERNTPGWMEKGEQHIDYLAYAFMPIRTAYLFPWPLLRRAWLVMGAEWKKRYQIIAAPNSLVRGGPVIYHTMSVCVPIEVLLKTIGDATKVTLPPPPVGPLPPLPSAPPSPQGRLF